MEVLPSSSGLLPLLLTLVIPKELGLPGKPKKAMYNHLIMLPCVHMEVLASLGANVNEICQ